MIDVLVVTATGWSTSHVNVLGFDVSLLSLVIKLKLGFSGTYF
jgi:hypothetical protein